MEKFDVAIIGGGSAGLAALKHLSTLGKQAILLEGGKKIGTKNVSGGILYSKNPKTGKVYNVEHVFDNFLTDAPVERKITKYILHTTSKDKMFSLDLTPTHDYQTNFGYTVMLNKLLSWFAKEASQSAEKMGGGIVSGVHVRSIIWKDENNIIIETDEIEPFQVKAIIAADGVNSEVAEITGARSKFTQSDLYQGVKVVVKLPEGLIEERFEISENEGAAHLFAGDITLNHTGGGFLYTNRDTISVGAVYHYDSLIENPAEPNALVNALLSNPFVMEMIKDEVPKSKESYKSLSKEEELRARFKASKLIKSWKELHHAYYSSSAITELLANGRYKTKDEIKNKIDSIYSELVSKYETDFETNYVELEYSAKLVPDGKRCRMRKPYFKNILFIGDAAGRGIFLGPRIEGINVGIDDAVRAAESVSKSIDQNNFHHNHLGELYTRSVEESPYTRDMTEIDKNYLRSFLDCTKQVPKDKLGYGYGTIFKLMSNNTFRDIIVGFANMLGYKRLLPILESDKTYTDIPVKIADKIGKDLQKSYSIAIPTIADRIAKLNYNDDSLSHIKVLNSQSDFMKKMVVLCPTKCYSIENERVMLQHEGCIECGTCAKETEWKHPRGEKGIIYHYG
ncbi:MAG: electron transfer flavoprotein [Thermoproteota archaeon]|nr:electron transfer flavoprotein [Thermoproteota archaeon]